MKVFVLAVCTYLFSSTGHCLCIGFWNERCLLKALKSTPQFSNDFPNDLAADELNSRLQVYTEFLNHYRTLDDRLKEEPTLNMLHHAFVSSDRRSRFLGRPMACFEKFGPSGCADRIFYLHRALDRIPVEAIDISNEKLREMVGSSPPKAEKHPEATD